MTGVLDLVEAYERALELRLMADALVRSLKAKLVENGFEPSFMKPNTREEVVSGLPESGVAPEDQCTHDLRPYGMRFEAVRCPKKAVENGLCVAHQPKRKAS